MDWNKFNFKDDYGVDDIIDFKELDYDFYDMDEFGNLDFTDTKTARSDQYQPSGSADTSSQKRPKAYFQHWVDKKKPKSNTKGITNN